MNLTAREQWWAEGVLRGATNQQLAAEAGISVRTVETYGLRWAQKVGLPKAGRAQGVFRESLLRMRIRELEEARG